MAHLYKGLQWRRKKYTSPPKKKNKNKNKKQQNKKKTTQKKPVEIDVVLWSKRRTVSTSLPAWTGAYRSK